MMCQHPSCDRAASIRMEIENVLDHRRIVGQYTPGKIQLMYYCLHHFYDEIMSLSSTINRDFPTLRELT